MHSFTRPSKPVLRSFHDQLRNAFGWLGVYLILNTNDSGQPLRGSFRLGIRLFRASAQNLHICDFFKNGSLNCRSF